MISITFYHIISQSGTGQIFSGIFMNYTYTHIHTLLYVNNFTKRERITMHSDVRRGKPERRGQKKKRHTFVQDSNGTPQNCLGFQ